MEEAREERGTGRDENEEEVSEEREVKCDEDEEEQGEEEVEVKGRRAPKGPSKQEREEHELTHMPYRSWCKHCVRGRGINNPHKKREGEREEDEVTRICMGYFL